MTTNERKLLMVAALGILGYLLWTEYQKNKALPLVAATADDTDAGNDTSMPSTTTEAPHNSIVVGDHTGEAGPTGGIKKAKPVVQSIVVGDNVGSDLDNMYKPVESGTTVNGKRIIAGGPVSFGAQPGYY